MSRKTGARNKGVPVPRRISPVTDLQCPRRPEGKTHILTNIEGANDRTLTRCRFCHRSWAALDMETRPAREAPGS